MNICKNCKHFISNGNVWYDQYCGASPRPICIHPQTGEKTYRSVNDLGKTYFTDEKYPHAREINPEGSCLLYEEI